LVIVVFLGVECPQAKLYGARLADMARALESRGVQFVGIDSNQHDSPSEVAQFIQTHAIPFPILKDKNGQVADRFGATRSPEVFVLDRHRALRYRGRIDDQNAGNVHRTKPTRLDLGIAVEELLAGRPVSEPETAAGGCLIDRAPPTSRRDSITYTRDVAPILNQHCIVCHRPGQIAPFALTNYEKVARWARTIREVVEEQRMPPWHADPAYGRFANDARLTDGEKQILARWVECGCPEGDPADLPAPPVFHEEWNIPGPDLVVSMPEPFTVPAEGIVPYQSFEVDPGFEEGRWIKAAEIRPGNRRVVHHCTVFLKPPRTEEPVEQGALGSFCLAATAPGTPPLVLPDGMAKLVPAGWHLVFLVHYATVGSVQTDQTRLGLLFADPHTVRQEVATKLIYDNDLCIPPHVADHRVEHIHQFHDDVLLLALFPHMHLRGKSFRYEVAYPDGTNEVLLDVRRYDFNWQNRYVLAEPKRLPSGTILRCIAHYDNSAGNPANPDPDATVHAGPQSQDEMFNGYFEWALADQDLTRPPGLAATVLARVRQMFRPVLLAIVGPPAGAFLLISRLRRSRRSLI
jgi:hypothetical protein